LEAYHPTAWQPVTVLASIVTGNDKHFHLSGLKVFNPSGSRGWTNAAALLY
jgi:hypothetical protein